MLPNKSDEDTVEILLVKAMSRPLGPQTGSARVQVDIAAQTHQGLVRSANEDHYLVVRFSRTLETLLTSLPPDQVAARSDEVGYALLVADGVGGAAAGELASRTALSTLVGLVLRTPDWILSDDERDTEQVMERMADRYRRIHAALQEEGRGDPNLTGMGTTMTLACSLGASLVIGHIGDSRAYLFRGGRLLQLTRDHTWVQALMDLGELTAEGAEQDVAHRVAGGSAASRATSSAPGSPTVTRSCSAPTG